MFLTFFFIGLVLGMAIGLFTGVAYNARLLRKNERQIEEIRATLVVQRDEALERLRACWEARANEHRRAP